ncbi:major tail protein [Clostridium sp. C2-6-12]|uniref:major tail protein n=1 Tax=Clostridium sp. C2-6-12 TaxID=2698832 RepID=UPI0013715234|nr:major tail protein [Clostridium sp. C2-6-12]
MSRTVGLRDISFAPLLTDTKEGATYGAVKKYERSVGAKLTPKTNSDTSYSDDTVEDIITTFSQIDVEIELNQLSVPTRAFLQGSKVVNGILIENKNDQAPYVYMAFKSKKANGAYRYICLYKGKFELVSDEYQTQEDKVKQGTAKLKGTFICRDFDENYRLIGDSDDESHTVTELESWLKTVPPVPVESTP